MSLENPQIPDLPALPAELRQMLERTFTYASEDETVRATARGDLRLSEVDVQVFPETDTDQLDEQLSLVCRAALDDALESTRAAVLASPLAGELAEPMLGLVQTAEPAPAGPHEATIGLVTAVAGPEGLLRVHVDNLLEPDRIGPETVKAVNAALQLARGGEDADQLERLARERLAELDATLDQLSARLDPVMRRLNEISQSLD